MSCRKYFSPKKPEAAKSRVSIVCRLVCILLVFCASFSAEALTPRNLDFDILYHYIDGDIEFLKMKLGELPLRETDEGSFYAVEYNDYSLYYWVADNDWIINRISVILPPGQVWEDQTALGWTVPMHFMGIWLGMPLEEAGKKVTNIPKWNPENFDLRVTFSDNSGSGLVEQIDVYSNKPVVVREHKEDFYLRWLERPVKPEIGHLGNGPFDTPVPVLDRERKVYAYRMEKGPDSWLKEYFFDEAGVIHRMRISMLSMKPFRGTVPSLFGVALNMKAETIADAVALEGRSIESRTALKKTHDFITTYKYTIRCAEREKRYRLEINVLDYDQRVKSVNVREAPALP